MLSVFDGMREKQKRMEAGFGYKRVKWYSEDYSICKTGTRIDNLYTMKPEFSRKASDCLVFQMDGLPVWFTCWESFLDGISHSKTRDAVRFFSRVAGGSLLHVRRLRTDTGLVTVPSLVVYSLLWDSLSSRPMISRIDWDRYIAEHWSLNCRFREYYWDVGKKELLGGRERCCPLSKVSVRECLSGAMFGS